MSGTDLLVVGCGNDLRSDDGAGRRVADVIEAMGLPGVAVRSQSQLTPELAEAVSGSGVVVFVDADLTVDRLTVSAVEAGGSSNRGPMTHHGDPGSILDLAATIGSLPAEAWLVRIPASDLGMGFDFSETTAMAVDEAVDAVVAMAVRVVT